MAKPCLTTCTNSTVTNHRCIEIKCSQCNGLGCSGWGPLAVPCIECGGTGLISLEVPCEFEAEIPTLDGEEFDELFG